MKPIEWSALALIVCAHCLLHTAAAAPVPSFSIDSQAMIQAFLDRESARLDAAFLEGVTNRAQWAARRAELFPQYMESLGLWPLPERTPLHPKITGVLERPEGFRVEKVHFQSRPQLYVTGNLYLPKDAQPGAKLPAVLYVCGHSGRGRDGNKTAFQHHGMWFATHGYACLIIDTLQLGEIAGLHHGTYRHDRWWWQARGYTSASVECWNGIRALDYLQSRPEVDPERLAVTGISGGGAASFWIAAADDRVKVAVPVSGMSDLEDYVGGKVVNGHCDCMFLINTFQWPWTHIAALVAPRPLLFANSGHDPIFPMNSNDRIRSRLERLYGFYTNRTERLFDIGVTPGGHDDKPELRLMAYRWINWHLKGDNSPVTESDWPAFEGTQLRVFPEDLPADEINTTIDEVFVPAAADSLPDSVESFALWRSAKLTELRRLVFRGLPTAFPLGEGLFGSDPGPQPGWLTTEPGIRIPWWFEPASNGLSSGTPWLVVLDEAEPTEERLGWLNAVVKEGVAVVVAPRGGGPMRWEDPAPFYIRRSLPLLGRTIDSCRLVDVLATAASALRPTGGRIDSWRIAGRGRAGVIAAYAALLEPGLSEIVLVDPPSSHRAGPYFLNVLRVLDVPEALGMLAPRSLTIYTDAPRKFDATASLYRAGGGDLRLRPLTGMIAEE